MLKGETGKITFQTRIILEEDRLGMAAEAAVTTKDIIVQSRRKTPGEIVFSMFRIEIMVKNLKRFGTCRVSDPNLT